MIGEVIKKSGWKSREANIYVFISRPSEMFLVDLTSRARAAIVAILCYSMLCRVMHCLFRSSHGHL